MADRVSVALTLGGAITADQYQELTALIRLEGLSIEWDGADGPVRMTGPAAIVFEGTWEAPAA